MPRASGAPSFPTHATYALRTPTTCILAVARSPATPLRRVAAGELSEASKAPRAEPDAAERNSQQINALLLAVQV